MVQCLHFFKRKPEASSSSLWKNLCEVFRPLEDDLIHHLYFIGEAVKRDETLQKSKAFDLPVENPEILSEKATSQTTEKAENQKCSKHIAIAQQHGHISAVQGPLLSDEHVEAYDLHVRNREVLSEKDTNQTTDGVINCKSSKNIVVAQHQDPVSKVHEPLLSKIDEAFDFPVKNHESVGEKDTSRKTEVENRKKPKIPGKSVHSFNSQVNNCDFNAEKNVSQTTTKAAATYLIKSQKQSTQCDKSNSQNDIATRDPYASATDEQPYKKSRILNDGVYFHGKPVKFSTFNI
nr:protein enhanced downy mildew 2-like [Tanacetum cinerariifolium]